MAALNIFFNRIREIFGKWLSRPQRHDNLLNNSFKTHYKTFRSLLTANNNALELKYKNAAREFSTSLFAWKI